MKSRRLSTGLWGSLSVFMLLLALGGQWFAPWPLDETVDIPFAPVSAQHWLGTDYLGADVLSRVLSGGRMLVMSGVLVVLLSWLLAGSAGMLAALSGGWRDKLALTFADILQSIPGMLMILLLVLLTGQQGYAVAMSGVLLVSAADIIRIARAATMQAMQQDYIDIARLRGESTGWILRHELAVGLLPLVSADAGVRFISAVFILASVSFLGLGATPPQADWGLMIMENRDGLALQPLAVLAPALALLLLLIPLTLLADVLSSAPASMRLQRSTGVKGNKQGGCAAGNSTHTELVNFGLSVGEKRLLDNISLRINPGRITALVGASGAGKTTLLHALAGELPAKSRQITGGVWLAGHQVSELSGRQCRRLRRNHIGYLPQDPRVALLPLQRVGGLLSRRARCCGIRGKQAQLLMAEQLSAVGLPADASFLRRLPHQLSGGQRQRLLLAMALLGNPALLLLDEADSAQDSVNTRILYRNVRRLAAERNIAVLLIAHNVFQVSDIAHEFVVLDGGKIEEITPGEQFLHKPQSQAGQRLISASYPVSLPVPLCSKGAHSGLEVKGLNAFYAQQPALTDINFTLRSGGCLSIVGASGCGKTTLLRCLLGLHPAATGTIQWQNTSLALNLAQRSRAQRSRLQYVPQNPYNSLNPYHSVYQLLLRPATLFAPQLHEQQYRRQICQALENVGLTADLVAMRVRQLSGGQRQRLALARALLAQPEILLCDEVTSALDAENRQAMLRLLCSLRSEHQLTLVMVTHDLTLAAQCGGDMLVMNNGHIIEAGTVASLIAMPCHPFTCALVENSALKTVAEPPQQWRLNHG